MTDDHRPARATLWREPLLHFLLIGAALFLLFRALGGGEAGAPREIVITGSRVAALQENFARTWLRPPTPAELQGLVADYVREEVFYREAIAMGLDRDDSVIRRRLRQKMEFVSEDLSAVPPPGDAELTKFLEAHREKFARPSRVSFEQVYFSPERRGEAVRRDAGRALEDLRSGHKAGSAGTVGDATMLPLTMEDATPRDIASVFGEDFAAELERAPLLEWSGPLQSSYGLHLVRVTARTGGALPTLAEIRPAVVQEWRAKQARQRAEQFYQSLLRKYDVRFEVAGRPRP